MPTAVAREIGSSVLSNKTFVAWLNSCLKESWKIWIGDLLNGLSADVFITLMETLTGDEIVNEEDNDGHDEFERINEYLNAKEIDAQINVEALKAGNSTETLNTLWLICLHFDVHSHKRACYQRTLRLGKRFMLDWIADEIDDKSFQDQDSFLTCFSNGNALQRLVGKYRKDFDEGVSEDGQESLNDVFNAIKLQWNIDNSEFSLDTLQDGSVSETELLIYLTILRRKILQENNSSSPAKGPESQTIQRSFRMESPKQRLFNDDENRLPKSGQTSPLSESPGKARPLDLKDFFAKLPLSPSRSDDSRTSPRKIDDSPKKSTTKIAKDDKDSLSQLLQSLSNRENESQIKAATESGPSTKPPATASPDLEVSAAEDMTWHSNTRDFNRNWALEFEVSDNIDTQNTLGRNLVEEKPNEMDDRFYDADKFVENRGNSEIQDEELMEINMASNADKNHTERMKISHSKDTSDASLVSSIDSIAMERTTGNTVDAHDIAAAGQMIPMLIISAPTPSNSSIYSNTSGSDASDGECYNAGNIVVIDAVNGDDGAVEHYEPEPAEQYKPEAAEFHTPEPTELDNLESTEPKSDQYQEPGHVEYFFSSSSPKFERQDDDVEYTDQKNTSLLTSWSEHQFSREIIPHKSTDDFISFESVQEASPVITWNSTRPYDVDKSLSDSDEDVEEDIFQTSIASTAELRKALERSGSLSVADEPVDMLDEKQAHSIDSRPNFWDKQNESMRESGTSMTQRQPFDVNKERIAKIRPTFEDRSEADQNNPRYFPLGNTILSELSTGKSPNATFVRENISSTSFAGKDNAISKSITSKDNVDSKSIISRKNTKSRTIVSTYNKTNNFETFDQLDNCLDELYSLALLKSRDLEQGRLEATQQIRLQMEDTCGGLPIDKISAVVFDRWGQIIDEIVEKNYLRTQESEEKREGLLREMRAELDVLARENFDLSKTASDVNSVKVRNDLLQKQISGLEQYVASLEGRVESQNRENGNLVHRLELLQDELSTKQSVYEVARRDYEDKVSSIRDQLAQMTEAHMNTESELAINKIESKKLENELSGIKNECKSDFERLQVESVSLRNKVIELQQQNEALKTANEADQTIIKHLETKIVSFENSCEQSKQDKREVMTDLQESRIREKNLVNKISSLNNDKESLAEKIQALLSEIADMGEEKKILNRELHSKISNETQSTEAMLGELRNLEKSLNSLRKEKTLVEEKYNTVKYENERLQKNLDILHKKFRNHKRGSKKELFKPRNDTPDSVSVSGSEFPFDSEAESLDSYVGFPERSDGSIHSPVPSVIVRSHEKTLQAAAQPSNPIPSVSTSTHQFSRAADSNSDRSYSVEDTRSFLRDMESKLQQTDKLLRSVKKSPHVKV